MNGVERNKSAILSQKNLTTLQIFLKDKSIYEFCLLGLHACVTLFSVVCVICGFVYYLISGVEYEKYEFFAHGWKYMHIFFSLWGSAIQTIYFNLILGIDVISYLAINSTKLYKLKNKLENVASYLLFSLVFPLSMSITLLFWGFYFLDRELIYPQKLDDVYPTWINHAMHSYPAVLTVVYLITSNKYEPQMKQTAIGTVGILVIYGICVAFIKMRDDKWVYLALQKLTDDQRTNVLTCGAVMNMFFLFVGHDFNKFQNSIKKMIKL